MSGTRKLKETSVPWYTGLTFEQIAARLDSGTAPGSDVPGAWIEVPHRFLTWYRLRQSGAAPRPAKADSDIARLTEQVRNVERTVGRLAAESRGIDAQFETVEANLQGLVDAVGKLSGRWLPMATAPRDGTRILVDFGRIGVHAVAWEEPANDSSPTWCVDDCKHGPYTLRGYLEEDLRGWCELPKGLS